MKSFEARSVIVQFAGGLKRRAERPV